MKYKIVSATSESELERKVNIAIEDGFKPLGHPIAIGPYNGVVVQAMIENEE